MENRIHTNWIGDALDHHANRNRAGLASAMGLNSSRIKEIIDGTRLVKVSEIPSLAAYLQISETDCLHLLLGHISEPPKQPSIHHDRERVLTITEMVLTENASLPESRTPEQLAQVISHFLCDADDWQRELFLDQAREKASQVLRVLHPRKD